MTDEEMDVIWSLASDAALHAWGPLGSPKHAPCPYDEDSEQGKHWWWCFHNEYARQNGY